MADGVETRIPEACEAEYRTLAKLASDEMTLVDLVSEDGSDPDGDGIWYLFL